MVTVPLHTRVRRAFNRGLTRFLSLFFSQKAQAKTIDPETVRRLLIVRPNYRIGNMLFLTPLINAIGAKMPQAEVDLLVGMRSAGAILEPLPNVGRVYDIPRKLLRQPLQLLRFIRKMRSHPYDVVINLMPSSSSSQIVTLLAKGRFKASFYDENSWCPLTHAVPLEFLNLHMALRPLEGARYQVERIRTRCGDGTTGQPARRTRHCSKGKDGHRPVPKRAVRQADCRRMVAGVV